MAAPLTVSRNNYFKNKKRSDIFTPLFVSKQLFEILDSPEIEIVFDPAIGEGALTNPWRESGRYILGCDVVDYSQHCDEFIKGPFEDVEKIVIQPDLIICNPPFSGHRGRKLYPEVFLRKMIELFGGDTSIVLFTPMGFRLNQRKHSKRWKWMRDDGPKITSIVSMPLDVFDGVEFHNEILMFNIDEVNPHYWLENVYGNSTTDTE